MQTTTWGSPMWITLHSITFNAPIKCSSEQSQKYNDFFNTLGDLLPCKWCRTSYKYFLKYIPIEEYSKDRAGLTFWLYTIHNIVNMKLRKECTMSFLDVVKKYNEMKVSKDTNLEEFVSNTINFYGNITKNRAELLIQSLNNNNWTFS